MLARQAVPAETRGEWSKVICERVCRSPLFRRATHVVAYVPCGAEVDPAGAAAAAVGTGRTLYYPAADGRLEARRARDVGVCADGQTADLETLSRNDEDVLFLVPGVGFDEAGARLGRGGGWYDRVLARFACAGRLGLAFELQLVPALPADPWDVAMHAVVTEQRVIERQPAASLPEGRA